MSIEKLAKMPPHYKNNNVVSKINELVNNFNYLIELIQGLSDENEWKVPKMSLADIEFKLRSVKK